MFSSSFLTFFLSRSLSFFDCVRGGGGNKEDGKLRKTMNNNLLIHFKVAGKVIKNMASRLQSFLVTRVIRKYHYWDISESNHRFDVKAMNVFDGSVYGTFSYYNVTFWPDREGWLRAEAHTVTVGFPLLSGSCFWLSRWGLLSSPVVLDRQFRQTDLVFPARDSIYLD